MHRVLVPLFALSLAACSKEAPSENPDTPPPATVPAAEPVAEPEAKAAPDPAPDPAASSAPKGYTTISKEAVDAMIAKVTVNKAGEKTWDDANMRVLEPSELTFAAFQGPIGPYEQGTIFFDNRVGIAKTITGWVISDTEANGVHTAWRFAHDTGALEEIKAVDFVDIGKDATRDILVEFDYITGMGPNGMEPIPSVVAVLWDDEVNDFVTSPDIFGDASVSTIEEAKKLLRENGQLD